VAKYRKKQALVEATQWFKEHDHLQVGQYRHPIVPGESMCATCRKRMDEHGWLDTSEGEAIVCPGDWIVVPAAGEGPRFKVAAEKFVRKYEPVEP